MRIVPSLALNSSAITRYNEDKRDRGGHVAELLFSSVDPGLKGQAMARALSPHPSTRTRARYKAVHIKVALQDFEEASNVDFAKVAMVVLREFGLHDKGFVVYRHYDQDHPHIHIVANRIGLDGKAATFSYSKVRSRELSRRLEEYMGFVQAEKQRLDAHGVRGEFHYPRERISQERLVTGKRYLQAMIVESRSNRPSEEVFYRRLARRNINLAFRPYRTKSGETKHGLSYAVLPGEPRFVMPGPGDNNAIMPNGLSVPNTEGMSSQVGPRFEYFRVRASRLGPAFQIDGHEKGIEVDLELRRKMESPLAFRRGKTDQNYVDSRAFIHDEPPEVGMLITAIERGNKVGVETAFNLGATLGQIPRDEIKYLPKDGLLEAQRIWEAKVARSGSPEIDFSLVEFTKELSYKAAVDDYAKIFGREANKASKDLLNAVLRRDFDTASVILDGPDYTLGTLPDPRILVGVSREDMPEELNSMVDSASESMAELSQQHEFLMPLRERQVTQRTRDFYTAMEEHRDFDAIDILRAEPDLDLSRLTRKQVDVVHDQYFDEFMNYVEAHFQKLDPAQRIDFAVRMEDSEVLFKELENYPQGVSRLSGVDLGWMSESARSDMHRAVEFYLAIQEYTTNPESVTQFAEAVNRRDFPQIGTLIEKSPMLVLTCPINLVMGSARTGEETEILRSALTKAVRIVNDNLELSSTLQSETEKAFEKGHDQGLEFGMELRRRGPIG